MRITLVISSLSGGGAERVASNMANYWAAKGWKVTILTTSYEHQSPCYDLHPNVVHRDMAATNSARPRPDTRTLEGLLELLNGCSQAERAVFIANFNHVLALRQAIMSANPDVVISFIDLTNIRVLLAAHGLGLPVIASEHCDPYFMGEGWEQLRRRLYPKAKYLTAPTEEALSYFKSMVGNRGRAIPSPVLLPDELDPDCAAAQPATGKTLLAMGRLAYEKGFGLLLQAFASIAKKHRCWSLEIWGEGPLRSELESLIAGLGLKERARLPGFTKRPFEVMRRADLFAVSSLCEGFSNVLVEAMACGLAVVSFDCPSGPRHIIRNGVDGMLVPPQNAAALAATLDRLMENEGERNRLAAKAPEAMERFGMEKVMKMWEELMLDSMG